MKKNIMALCLAAMALMSCKDTRLRDNHMIVESVELQSDQTFKITLTKHDSESGHAYYYSRNRLQAGDTLFTSDEINVDNYKLQSQVSMLIADTALYQKQIRELRNELQILKSAINK